MLLMYLPFVIYSASMQMLLENLGSPTRRERERTTIVRCVLMRGWARVRALPLKLDHRRLSCLRGPHWFCARGQSRHVI